MLRATGGIKTIWVIFVMAEPREYSLIEKGSVILDIDLRGNMASVAKEHGVPRETVRSWYRNRDDIGFPKSDSLQLIRAQWEEKVGGLFEDSLKILDMANKQVIRQLPEASASQAAVIFGIYYDKTEKLRALGACDDGPSGLDDMSAGEQLAFAKQIVARMEDVVDADFEVVDDGASC